MVTVSEAPENALEARAFFALLPDLCDDRAQGEASGVSGVSGVTLRHAFPRRLRAVLTLYLLTVTGASAALFLIGVLLRRW